MIPHSAQYCPLPFFRASPPLHAAPHPLPPASPLGCALRGGRSGLRDPASMAARLPSHARRAARPLSCVPFGLCLAGKQERPPQARFHDALPLPCPRLPLRAVPAGRQKHLPRSRSYAALPLHACRAAHPFSHASPSDCALRGGKSTSRKPASMTRLPPMHAAPRTSPPALPLRAVPAKRQKHLPQARFHGALPLPCTSAPPLIQQGDPLPRPLCRTGSETFIPSRICGKKRAARA